MAASVTTDTTEAERTPRRPTAPEVAEADGSAGIDDASANDASSDASASDAEGTSGTAQAPIDASGLAAAEATRTWHPGGPEEGDADEPVVDEFEPVDEPALDEPAPGDPSDEPAPTPGTPESSPDGERGVAVIPLTTAPATAAKATPRKKRTLRVARDAPAADAPVVLAIDGLVKRYGDTTAVDAISLDIRAGSFYGIVGPNGAGKTTTLSMITGLLRPDGGSVHVHGIDVWKDPRGAKRITGVLPDRLRLFDRLTGSEMLYYSGSLRGLDHRTVLERSADLADAFGLDDALDRLVADYSAGMTKKIALACAMIHSPRVLVLDEPFESVDPVSAANLTDILERYVGGGGTVLLSSHGMDLIERVCDSAAIIVGGRVLASGTLDEVRQGDTLEDRFVELAGGRKAAEGMEWLHSFSD
ncbi:hypothetical protein GCM10025870_30670 [Agromyces marinus]|uniref:ABC transporter domain-containing protein n=1 Tax=Agromyces marinus TaxID=1389020 RepID=A0ABM8H599_9MICO|nr:hypothetical protein GCM10025870_30670 [Agromyces marinus]